MKMEHANLKYGSCQSSIIVTKDQRYLPHGRAELGIDWCHSGHIECNEPHRTCR